MQEQSFKNHLKFSPLFHFVTVPISMGIIGLTVFNLTKGINSLSVMLFLISVVLIFTLTLVRVYAIKNQDRIIRAEENLRYFSMTGKLLNTGYKMSQITALRFASDEEFVVLSDKALKDNMSSKDIKQSISNWRADNFRV